jgi:hypothetical protein
MARNYKHVEPSNEGCVTLGCTVQEGGTANVHEHPHNDTV